MRFETGELESVPILLVQALANDGETWTIQVTTDDGETHEGDLLDADWECLVLADEPGGTEGSSIDWDDVALVRID